MAQSLGTLTDIAAAIRETDVAQARIAEINKSAEEKQKEILKIIEETKKTIPEDYTKLTEEVSGLNETLLAQMQLDTDGTFYVYMDE